MKNHFGFHALHSTAKNERFISRWSLFEKALWVVASQLSAYIVNTSSPTVRSNTATNQKTFCLYFRKCTRTNETQFPHRSRSATGPGIQSQVQSFVIRRLQLPGGVRVLSTSLRLLAVLRMRVWWCSSGKLYRRTDVQPRVADLRLATKRRL